MTLTVGFLCVFLYLAAARTLPLLARMRGGDIAGSLALGVLGFAAYQVLTFSALARIPASMNAVLVSSNVVLIAILSVVFLKERISWQRAAGILVAFAGVVLVTFNRGFALGGSIDLLGCAFSLLAALCFAAVHHPGQAPGRAQRPADRHRARPVRRRRAARGGDRRAPSAFRPCGRRGGRPGG